MPRKVAFSAKAKKKQLQAKRDEKRDLPFGEKREKVKFIPQQSDEETASSSIIPTSQALNQQPQGRSRNINRYNLKFHVETKEEIEARKEQARLPVKKEPDTELEQGTEFCYIPGLEFPKRPKWEYDVSPQLLDMKENKYFRLYVDQIEKSYPVSELSYFELNLETWRQLWRVLEMSDIVLVVVDARFPNLLFPPSLYTFVTEELKRDLVLVFNKIDLVPASVVLAWKYYFKSQFPRIKTVFFTSLPSYNLREGGRNTGMKSQRRKGRMRMAAEGALNLLQVCEEICGSQVDLSGWRTKVMEEMAAKDDDVEMEVGEVIQSKKPDVSYHEQERFQNGMLTIGCIGQPNVGKSSLINAVKGNKVVSVSKTPGHTKHFQTIFLTPNVRLCDCPGLVFPSRLPRPLQILTGSFPIAHVREPYTSVGYLAKYLDLPGLLQIRHPGEDDRDARPAGEPLEWSAYDLCEGWAVKRGFMTKKAARPDVARAANHLLRMALEGRVCLYTRPPNYSAERLCWETHAELQAVVDVQALSAAPAGDQQRPWQDELDVDTDDRDDDDDDDEDEDGDGGQQAEGESADDEEESTSASSDENPTQQRTNMYALLPEDD